MRIREIGAVASPLGEDKVRFERLAPRLRGPGEFDDGSELEPFHQSGQPIDSEDLADTITPWWIPYEGWKIDKNISFYRTRFGSGFRLSSELIKSFPAYLRAPWIKGHYGWYETGKLDCLIPLMCRRAFPSGAAKRAEKLFYDRYPDLARSVLSDRPKPLKVLAKLTPEMLNIHHFSKHDGFYVRIANHQFLFRMWREPGTFRLTFGDTARMAITGVEASLGQQCVYSVELFNISHGQSSIRLEDVGPRDMLALYDAFGIHPPGVPGSSWRSSVAIEGLNMWLLNNKGTARKEIAAIHRYAPDWPRVALGMIEQPLPDDGPTRLEVVNAIRELYRIDGLEHDFAHLMSGG